LKQKFVIGVILIFSSKSLIFISSLLKLFQLNDQPSTINILMMGI